MSSKNYVRFAESEHVRRPNTSRLRDSDPNERIEVSLYLKPRGDRPARETLESMKSRRESDHADDIRRIGEFAKEAGLRVTTTEPVRRLVKLEGSVSDMQSAFRTSIGVYGDGKAEFRSHSDSLFLPDDVMPIVESVLGIDNRPVVRHHARAAAASAYLPNEIGVLYGFPTAGTGTGQCVGILEFGGGYLPADMTKEFAEMKLPVPSVTAVSVDGAKNDPSGTEADGEVALDIQVVGGVAPGAKIAVYFAPNSTQGNVDAITQAATDSANKPSVLSTSWGGPEVDWGTQAMTSINSALQDAASLGISAFYASGDNLSSDGLNNGKANVNFPASSPWAIGVGGTTIETSGNAITSETVWNDGGTSGTGGGVSDYFAVPSFQAHTKLQPSVNDGQTRRGVPDVAANADPSSGYIVYVHGKRQPVGGTSAATPLWAGLTALLNQQAPERLGFFLPTLYANPGWLRVITEGNNIATSLGKGYSATDGWSGCTGLGVPIGKALLAGLVKPA